MGVSAGSQEKGQLPNWKALQGPLPYLVGIFQFKDLVLVLVMLLDRASSKLPFVWKWLSFEDRIDIAATDRHL